MPVPFRGIPHDISSLSHILPSTPFTRYAHWYARGGNCAVWLRSRSSWPDGCAQGPHWRRRRTRRAAAGTVVPAESKPAEHQPSHSSSPRPMGRAGAVAHRSVLFPVRVLHAGTSTTIADHQQSYLFDAEYHFKETWLGGQWIAGMALFQNSFGQFSQYLFGGLVWRPIEEHQPFYVKLTAGPLHGYTGQYQDKVPYNSSTAGAGDHSRRRLLRDEALLRRIRAARHQCRAVHDRHDRTLARLAPSAVTTVRRNVIRGAPQASVAPGRP